jgi:hypothetical protein
MYVFRNVSLLAARTSHFSAAVPAGSKAEAIAKIVQAKLHDEQHDDAHKTRCAVRLEQLCAELGLEDRTMRYQWPASHLALLEQLQAQVAAEVPPPVPCLIGSVDRAAVLSMDAGELRANLEAAEVLVLPSDSCRVYVHGASQLPRS